MNSDDLLRDQINQVIRDEIQSTINDYVDQKEAVESLVLVLSKRKMRKNSRLRLRIQK